MRYCFIVLLTILCLPTFGQLIYGGYYFGMHDKKIWEYEFHADGTYWSRCQSRKIKQSTGRYVIAADTVILTSMPTDTIEQKYFYELKGKKLLVMLDSCIVDLGSGYDYCLRYFKDMGGDSLMLLPSERRFKPAKKFK